MKIPTRKCRFSSPHPPPVYKEDFRVGNRQNFPDIVPNFFARQTYYSDLSVSYSYVECSETFSGLIRRVHHFETPVAPPCQSISSEPGHQVVPINCLA